MKRFYQRALQIVTNVSLVLYFGSLIILALTWITRSDLDTISEDWSTFDFSLSDIPENVSAFLKNNEHDIDMFEKMVTVQVCTGCSKRNGKPNPYTFSSIQQSRQRCFSGRGDFENMVYVYLSKKCLRLKKTGILVKKNTCTFRIVSYCSFFIDILRHGLMYNWFWITCRYLIWLKLGWRGIWHIRILKGPQLALQGRSNQWAAAQMWAQGWFLGGPRGIAKFHNSDIYMCASPF